MGMFDTIHLPEPLQLPGCVKGVTEFQTKAFGCLLEDYTIGSVLSDSPVLIGVVPETAWCEPEKEEEKGGFIPVYITVWHSILVGVYASPEEAEARLREVDRADLIAWLDEAQRQTRRWQRCFRGLVADIRELRERQQESNEDDKQDSRFRTLIHRLPDEILQGPDPLGAILDKNRNQKKPDGG